MSLLQLADRTTERIIKQSKLESIWCLSHYVLLALKQHYSYNSRQAGSGGMSRNIYAVHQRAASTSRTILTPVQQMQLRFMTSLHATIMRMLGAGCILNVELAGSYRS